MSVLVIDLQYFPCVDYYLTLIKFAHCKLDIYERHQKLSFGNRFLIAGANGIIKLTVPLVGGRDQKCLFKDLKIDYTSGWRVQHLRAVCSAYRRAPYFEFFEDSFSDLFATKCEWLMDWNLKCMHWLNAQVGASTQISLVDNPDQTVSLDENLDLRRTFTPKYRPDSVVSYRQVFQERIGFQPNLSILDMLFCIGPSGIWNAANRRDD